MAEQNTRKPYRSLLLLADVGGADIEQSTEVIRVGTGLTLARDSEGIPELRAGVEAITIEVQQDDTPVGSGEHDVLDFSPRFAVTESPAGEANVDLAVPIARADLPAPVAYEDEANNFTANNNFNAHANSRIVLPVGTDKWAT